MSNSDCLFCRIAAGDVPADIVYDDKQVMAFRDINPQAPTHILIIPRRHIATLNDVAQDDVETIGHLSLAAAKIAREAGIDQEGYRTVVNCNANAGQTVFHVHMHVLGGRPMIWPPG